MTDDNLLIEYSEAIKACCDFLKRATKEADCTDPKVIVAVTGFFEVLTEAHTTKRVVDLRIAQFDALTKANLLLR